MSKQFPQDKRSAVDKTKDASQFIKRQQIQTKHEASDEDFNFIREIVYKLSRISIGPNKRVMMLSRISRRIRALQISSVKDYCEYIKKPTGSKELSALIDAISTNHTYFFREAQHFSYLESAILQNRVQQTIRPFKVWSAASSSGEEPYSIGMALMEHARSNAGFDWRMDATDISTTVLDRAQKAVYPISSLERVPEHYVKHHCIKNASDETFTVSKDIQRRIQFQQANLFELPPSLSNDYDLIVCRNVMIYFDRPTREQLINSLIRHLKPDGTLFVGHSESLNGLQHHLKMVRPAIYIKAH
jgi:chemotaxis protein methyltransferase CheR